MGAGMLIILWSIFFIESRSGGNILILLSIVLFFIGGGFIPPFIGIIAGILGRRINKPPGWPGGYWAERMRPMLEKWWPWSLILYFLFSGLQFLSGRLWPDMVIENSSWITFLEFGLLLIVVFSNLSYDFDRFKSA
jgi:hypothetical protein